MNIIEMLLKNTNGTKVKLSGSKGMLLNVANGEKFVFEPEDSGDCKILTRNNVIDMFGKTLVAINTKEPLTNQPPLTPKLLKELERRKAYVDRFNAIRKDGKIGGIKYLQDLTTYVAKLIDDPCPPCRTELIKWIEKARKSVAGVRATLPSQRKKKKSIFSEETRDLALECIGDYYLILSEPPMQFAFDCFVTKYKKMFPKCKKYPCYKTFTDWIKQIPIHDVVLARKGRKALKAAKRNKTSMLITDHILERVEVDAVHFSMGAIDEQGNYLGKVVGFFAIDCYSRSILGYTLQIGTGEKASSVIDSYRNAILQNDPSIKCPDVKNDWPMCGLIELVVSDGGPGYTADATVQFLLDLNTTWQVAEAGAGWRKPYIEGWFNCLRRQLLSTMPGYCRKVSDARELDVPLKKQACYTVAEIENLLTQWIVDDYHQTAHTGLGGKTPQEVWESQAATYVMLPDNEDELRLQQGDFVYRTILGDSSEAGVVNYKIRYNDVSGRLQEIGNIKKAKGEPATIQIKYNINDISRVTAIDDETGELLELIATDPRITAGMRLVEYKALHPSKEYSEKGFGHNRTTTDNPVRNAPKAIHDQIMKDASTKTPRGANDLTTLANTEPVETEAASDEPTTSTTRKLPNVKAHKDA